MKGSNDQLSFAKDNKDNYDTTDHKLILKLNSIEDSTDYARLQQPEAEYQEVNEVQAATDNKDKEDGEPLYNNPAYYLNSRTTDECAEYQEIKEIQSADCSQGEPVYKTVINSMYGDISEEEQPSSDNYVPNPLYGGVKEQGQ